MKKYLGLMVLLVVVALASACNIVSPGQQLPKDSQLVISLTDKPATDVKEVWVTITKVEIEKADEGRMVLNDLSANPLKVDLLTLRFDETLLGNSKLPEGQYDKIWLTVDTAAGANTVVTNDGVTHALKVPSKSFKINYTFSIEPGTVTELVMDADVRDFISLRGNENNNNGFIINPTAIRVYQKRISSNIFGKVVDASGNAITATNVIVDVYDQNNVLVTSTVALAADLTGQDEQITPAGSFVLKGLLAGTYTLVVNAEGYTQYTSEPMTIEADKDVTLTDNIVLQVAQPE